MITEPVTIFAMDFNEVCCLGILCDAKNRINTVPFMNFLVFSRPFHVLLMAVIS